MKVEFTVHFDKGYIAHPYWPEQEKLINVQKESGMRRVRSAEKASRALADWLAAHGMTQDDYQELERLAARPFYTDGSAEIIIPEHQVYGLFAQSCDLSTSSIRIARAEQVRSVLLTTAWRTGKTASDGIWERFVVVTSGTGGKLSNQRALRSNPYIAGFDARGMLSFSADILDAVKVKKFLEFAGREVGIGASRKLGWGRFEVTGWKVG